MDQTPRIIFWETTKRCALKCGYCRMLKGDNTGELATGEAFQMLREVKKAFGSPVMVLSGGEPLSREDILEIVGFSAAQGLPTALATNGVLLGEAQARGLKASGIRRVSISFDSAEEKRHDLSRGVAGAFQKAVDASAHLREQKIPFQINLTVTRANMNEIRCVAEFAMRLGACAVHYFILVPVGCGRQIQSHAMLEAHDIEETLKVINALSGEIPLEIRPTCAPQYVRLDKAGHGQSGCLAGTRALFISAEGDVYPCGYLPVKAGSLRESSLRDIWLNSSVLKTLRQNDLKGACGDCYAKENCRGCRARAYGLTGDYMAGDETCVNSAKL